MVESNQHVLNVHCLDGPVKMQELDDHFPPRSVFPQIGLARNHRGDNSSYWRRVFAYGLFPIDLEQATFPICLSLLT